MTNEEKKTSIDIALEELDGELRQATTELYDIRGKIDTSRGQVEALAQRNASLIGEVRRIESAIAQTPSTDVQAAYIEAMESQQRLLTIRSQMEKLQAQETLVMNTIKGLENIKKSLETGPEPEDKTQTFIKVVDAQEEERERLARAMHDGPAHSLTNFILQAEICQKLFDRDTEKARLELDNLQTSAREAFQRVRDFIFDLRPMMLTDLGLVPTVKRYLDAYETKTNIEPHLSIQGRERRLEGYREVLMFRGIQELLVNVRDHAQASEVKVSIDMGEDTITAQVEDNGRGFETGKLTFDGSSESGAIGLSTLQNRLNLIGGSIQIDSVTGQGAKIELSIPAGPDQAEELDI